MAGAPLTFPAPVGRRCCKNHRDAKLCGPGGAAGDMSPHSSTRTGWSSSMLSGVTRQSYASSCTASCHGPAKRLAERGVGGPVGAKGVGAFHLNHDEHTAAPALAGQGCELVHVLQAAQGWRVGGNRRTRPFPGCSPLPPPAFFLPCLFCVKIKAGIAQPVFGPKARPAGQKAACGQPLLGGGVGGGGIHVHQQGALFHRHQVRGVLRAGFSLRSRYTRAPGTKSSAQRPLFYMRGERFAFAAHRSP